MFVDTFVHFGERKDPWSIRSNAFAELQTW